MLGRVTDDNHGLFGRFTKTTPSHIIDHGSVSYLALLQILLYDQQDVLLLFKNNNGQCAMNIRNDNDNNDRDITLQAIATTVGNDNDVYHVVMNVYDMTINGIVSVSVADEATFSV